MLFLLFLAFFSAPAAAVAGTPHEWLRLFHPGSGLDGDGFYLTNERTPEAELTAFVTEVRARGGDASAACRFPARFRVAKKLGYLSGERGTCPRFDQWRGLIRPSGVELVFASAFINSPSSMYGHTFLKFPRAGKTSGKDLLDYSVSFGADTGTSGGLAYVWRGLTGGFPGTFSTAPFYLKVKEYGEMESRDLWVYMLKFSAAETELILEHLWELREVKFPYYFLSRNCAYFLLALLEVGRADLALTENFPLWSIPIDTIRSLERADLVHGREMRASLLSALTSKRRGLSANEEDWAYRVGTDVSEVDRLPVLTPERRAAVLDAAYSFFRYRRGVARENDPALRKEEERLFKARGLYRPGAVPAEKSAPEAGHRSERLGISFGGVRHENAFGEIRYRAALHDLLDAPGGYEGHSAVAMGDFVARWQNSAFILEEADLLKIQSIAPTDRWTTRVAWNFTLGFDQARWIPCERWHCSSGKLDGGPGVSFRILRRDDSAIFLFLNSAFRAGPVFEKNLQWDVGPLGGVFLPMAKNWRFLAEGERRFSLAGGSLAKTAVRIGTAMELSSDSQVRITANKERAFAEGSVTYFRYF